MIRAFLAIELPPDLRAALSTLQQDLKQRCERVVDRHVRVSWVQPASMHLTLKFLGDIPEEMIAPLRTAIEQAASDHRVMQVALSRLGTFPRPQAPRVLWAGPLESWEQGAEGLRLQALHRAVEEACRAEGLAPEARPFSPHLTIARIKEGEREVGQILARSGVLDRPVTLGTLPIGTIILMKSELRPSGSIYTRLWECPLAHSAA